MEAPKWIRGPAIGRGSSATVSVAMAGSELLAVKSAELSRSHFLQRERSILAFLASPRIVRYVGHDVTVEKGESFFNLLMEYVGGGTLADAIKQRGGHLDETEIRSHTSAILQGLSYLHSKQFVHCDIKGQNILMAPDGPKIADLGCAKWADEVSTQPISGTPLYMAPEVARGEEQGFPADIWALGCTVIEMATGRSPWAAVAESASVLYRIAYSGDVPEFPCGLSEQATDFLEKCLRRNPAERWSADQLLNHPFFHESSSSFSDCEIPTNSPTSILDQDFWDSLDDSEAEASPSPIPSTGLRSTSDRIRSLSNGSSLSRVPDWTREDDWITVRRQDESEFAPAETEADRITNSTEETGVPQLLWESEPDFDARPVYVNDEYPTSSSPAELEAGICIRDTEHKSDSVFTNYILSCEETVETSSKFDNKAFTFSKFGSPFCSSVPFSHFCMALIVNS